MIENSRPSIQIDLNEFKLHLRLKNKIQLTLHFNSSSRRFYLAVIALVVQEMKKPGKIKSVPLREHLELLALLNECDRAGIENVRIHGLLDGRDVPPLSALRFFGEIEDVRVGGGHRLHADAFPQPENQREEEGQHQALSQGDLEGARQERTGRAAGDGRGLFAAGADPDADCADHGHGGAARGRVRDHPSVPRDAVHDGGSREQVQGQELHRHRRVSRRGCAERLDQDNDRTAGAAAGGCGGGRGRDRADLGRAARRRRAAWVSRAEEFAHQGRGIGGPGAAPGGGDRRRAGDGLLQSAKPIRCVCILAIGR